MINKITVSFYSKDPKYRAKTYPAELREYAYAVNHKFIHVIINNMGVSFERYSCVDGKYYICIDDFFDEHYRYPIAEDINNAILKEMSNG